MEKSEPFLLAQSLSRFASHLFGWVRGSLSLWSMWWKTSSWFQRLLPAGLIGLYWFVLLLLNGLRGDHFIMGGLLLLLGYGKPLFRSATTFFFPFILTGVVYDSQRFYSDYIRGPVHVQEPYYFDKYFFGIQTPQGVLTPNEWFQLHIHPVLDLITGFAYLVFVAVFACIAGYFCFYLSKKGTKKCTSEEMKISARLMPWSFFWLNILGYSTYYLYSAAPPWYVTLYGLGPAKLDVAASSAGCVRFDQILGTHFFSEMYGRSADVFGAVPSLHVAYPFLALYFAFKYGAARAFCVGFYLLMCFSAVYLNHHYILDILWGTSYAFLIGWLSFRYAAYQKLKKVNHATFSIHIPVKS